MTHDPDLHIIECYLKATHANPVIFQALNRARARVVHFAAVEDKKKPLEKKQHFLHLDPQRVKRLAETMKDREIGEYLHVNVKSIQSFRARHQIKACRLKKVTPTLDRDKKYLRQLVQEQSDKRIAQAYGCSECTFYKWRLKNKIIRKSRIKPYIAFSKKEKTEYESLKLPGDITTYTDKDGLEVHVIPPAWARGVKPQPNVNQRS